ncbi:tRNA epoxyqueuosine(34) reductase QueG [Zophobihabitans entericus]|uniref:tRNA epoxyqueuosine(34) reductase QueG n=1 Tax=Zophobihabitans entericus TaxID=1635327 RepID=UPI001AAFCB66|nr:tRNA epoxyqueuosine(34) reductase QueG [Zophobihabitans entericus]
MIDYTKLTQLIKQWGLELGFQQVGICDVDLSAEEPKLQSWLDKQYHGEMDWMASHGMMRARPAELHPGTLRVISVRMNYFPQQSDSANTLSDPDKGYISRYALGRDYHKVMRARLKQLGEKIKEYCHGLNYRPFVDSAPILERTLAEKAGLGWRGKHSLIMNETGSWFFLGELLVNIPLPVDEAVNEKCGKCQACLQICPTQAIVAPYLVDARRCISYLTIEYSGVIPEEFRAAIGNRIYGCDDCQLICPWNREPTYTQEADFTPRHQLSSSKLLELYQWNEQQFMSFTEGTPIRRIGYQNWLRNITIALGNAPYSQEIVQALESHKQISELLDIHINWSLAQQAKSQLEIIPVNTQKARLIRQITSRY